MKLFEWIAALCLFILPLTVGLVPVICIFLAGWYYPSLVARLKDYYTVSKAVEDIWNKIWGPRQRGRQQTSLNTDSGPLATDSRPLDTDSRPLDTDSRPLDTDRGPLGTDNRPPDEPVGPPLSDDAAVEIIVSRISNKWKNLGRRLGMTDDELDNIDSDHKGQREKAHQMLRAYRNNADQPILDKLVKACRKERRADIASELLKLKQE
ncbi:uncharacterized protein LOC124126533 [Haliotis rufescens]|uniref:uncharacterized protein LOC124126533 n=1 Tax=Haliotis rufescens TaxID=6454 RepID=UPI00201F2B90|nr:uncharacterized protein LOC124126533 [Haliotis rufescens]XP_046345948.2 uncharacterized protein LOC124126533 [Haliotis rufescens]XP_046345949.2 uncharacterized protein LOC124126533 [Haliotis rufescens]